MGGRAWLEDFWVWSKGGYTPLLLRWGLPGSVHRRRGCPIACRTDKRARGVSLPCWGCMLDASSDAMLSKSSRKALQELPAHLVVSQDLWQGRTTSPCCGSVAEARGIAAVSLCHLVPYLHPSARYSVEDPGGGFACLLPFIFQLLLESLQDVLLIWEGINVFGWRLCHSQAA